MSIQIDKNYLASLEKKQKELENAISRIDKVKELIHQEYSKITAERLRLEKCLLTVLTDKQAFKKEIQAEQESRIEAEAEKIVENILGSVYERADLFEIPPVGMAENSRPETPEETKARYAKMFGVEKLEDLNKPKRLTTEEVLDQAIDNFNRIFALYQKLDDRLCDLGTRLANLEHRLEAEADYRQEVQERSTR